MTLHPLNFTFAGRLIVLIAVCIAVGGTVGLAAWPNEFIAAVRLPLFVLALPPLCAAGVFVALGMLVLKLFGLDFYFPAADELEQ